MLGVELTLSQNPVAIAPGSDFGNLLQRAASLPVAQPFEHRPHDNGL